MAGHWHDLVPGAVELAKHNCQRHKLKNVTFLQSSRAGTGIFQPSHDLIVSNPPYIEEETAIYQRVMSVLSQHRHWCRGGGLQDLDSHRSESGLSRNGRLAAGRARLPTGAAVRELFEQAGFAAVETRLDLNGLSVLPGLAEMEARKQTAGIESQQFDYGNNIRRLSAANAGTAGTHNHSDPETVDSQWLSPEIGQRQ